MEITAKFRSAVKKEHNYTCACCKAKAGMYRVFNEHGSFITDDDWLMRQYIEAGLKWYIIQLYVVLRPGYFTSYLPGDYIPVCQSCRNKITGARRKQAPKRSQQ